ncbi:indolethylamine N-methyltransferase [Lingula anatina]|uniref:Indolethylamine N-methyltransferase n=1 Tax=Lingula anatina TaxID=7574 RepID=A0A1S3HSH7_LINAN|nr:indolethylamine N-methyltransferase [Lingula anatina]|eukprot:XP_013388501.1 indolethylamine N-methyltransferase [Lingula anatina]
MSVDDKSPEPAIRSGEDYNTIFDDQAYLKAYHDGVEGHPDEPEFMPFVINTLHTIFNSGLIKGSRLLDIGSGPCIHNVISASKWFDEITFTDFADVNRRALKKWWQNDDGAWNWEPFFKYVANLEGNADNWEEDQKAFRKKIKDVLHCDINKMNPIYPNQSDHFDAVTSSLCIEASCADVHAYEQAIKNVVSLLKAKGHLVLVGVLGESYYDVGGERFFCLPLTKDEVTRALEKAGLENIAWYPYDTKSADTVSDFAGCFIATATKKEDV